MRSSWVSFSRSAPLPRPTLTALAVAALFSSIPAAWAADGDVITPPTMSAVDVVGRSASGTYYADEAEGAKTSLPLRELPQSVRVMSRQTLDDLGATRLDDVLDYVGGVSRQNNFGGLWDNIAIRGLPGNENTGMATLLNGFSSNRGFNAPRDLAGVERIEFLKGPAAALYGSSEPGGTLNIVSKKPLWKAAHSVEAYAGSHGLGISVAGIIKTHAPNMMHRSHHIVQTVVGPQPRHPGPAAWIPLALHAHKNPHPTCVFSGKTPRFAHVGRKTGLHPDRRPAQRHFVRIEPTIVRRRHVLGQSNADKALLMVRSDDLGQTVLGVITELSTVTAMQANFQHRPHSMRAQISSGAFGMAALSTSTPKSVTRTSSSMRIPPKSSQSSTA